nr:SDR family oxidoreductase [Pseudomaricurvus alkylphenolicus]
MQEGVVDTQQRFDDKVVVITGAGSGLGRSYALEFARRGAKVVVNDLGGDVTGGGKSSAAADAVVQKIKASGGEALASYDSVEDGDAIIQAALDHYGRVDVLVNNAGILRDSSFKNMSDKDWDLVYRVHLLGSYKVTKAAWPHMLEQGYGRIVNTASGAGLYGSFGQANYSAVKMALVGLTNTLAVEGAAKGIQANVIAPAAGSRLTETVFPTEVVSALKPEFITPLVVNLCSESCKESGGLFELGAGWMAKVRWQRSMGVNFDVKAGFSAEDVAESWGEICNFSEFDNPTNISESLTPLLKNVGISF